MKICNSVDNSSLENYSCIGRGLYFGSKTIFIPPPFWKWYFSPSRDTSFFHSHCGLFSLILPYFAFTLTFYFPFSDFFPISSFFFSLSSFFFSLSSFFFYIFPPFPLPLFIFFPSNYIGWYSPTRGGEGYFPIYRPLCIGYWKPLFRIKIRIEQH